VQALAVLLGSSSLLVASTNLVLESVRVVRRALPAVISAPQMTAYQLAPADGSGPITSPPIPLTPASAAKGPSSPLRTDFSQMSSREFEDAVAALFARWGFRVQQTPYANDGGKDALVWRDGCKFLVECKRYSSGQSVHRRDLQILVAAMQDEEAAGGYFVTTGRFTLAAEKYAPQHKIELMDGKALARLAQQLNGGSQQELFESRSPGATPLPRSQPRPSRRSASPRIHRGS
jgi:HJR/Mrr/RecB family endonuclease